MRVALELAERDSRYYMPFQYANEANPRAHYEGTGAEIAEALPRVDAFVAGLGTGGTLMGCGERLRESFPDVQVVAAEPLQGDPVYGPAVARGRLHAADPRRLEARPEDPRRRTRRPSLGLRMLLEREGIFAGVSSRRGRPRRAADRRASSTRASSSCVLADGGWKYLSADFWTQPLDEVERSMEDRVWW